LHWKELTIVANSSEATVIFLQSHPAWVAAQRYARERSEAIRRHPSCRARQRSAASGCDATPLIRNFKLYTSNNTPA
jgi:hypothetical protein